MFIQSVSGAETVLANFRPDGKNQKRILFSGRNMTVSEQIALRDFEDFDIREVSVSVPEHVTAEVYFAQNEIFNDGIPYPDRLVLHPVSVKAHTTQVIRTVLEVDGDAPTGEFDVNILIRTSLGEFTVTDTLKIYPVDLPEPKDSEIGHEYFFDIFEFLRGKKKETDFSNLEKLMPEWEKSVITTAKLMKGLRINALRLPAVELLSCAGSEKKDGVWKLDFSLFDRLTELMLEHGSFKNIVTAHFARAVDGGEIYAPDGKGGTVSLEIGTDEAEEWIKTFLVALGEHFAQKGWLEKLIVHIQDEPHGEKTWLWAREKVREYLPGVRCAEPLDTHETATKLVGACDIYIPRFEVFESGEEFYESRRAAGDSLWCYCCCYPEGFDYLNRFIDEPLVYSKLIGWACFSRHMEGFLHWGFDFWGGEMYGRDPKARFKGDGYIVYPEKDTVLPSARYFALIDGMFDWELLKMLEKKFPGAAYSLASCAVRTFYDFSTDTALLERLRGEILEMLSK